MAIKRVEKNEDFDTFDVDKGRRQAVKTIIAESVP